MPRPPTQGALVSGGYPAPSSLNEDGDVLRSGRARVLPPPSSDGPPIESVDHYLRRVEIALRWRGIEGVDLSDGCTQLPGTVV